MDVMQKKRVPRTVKTGDRRTRLELERDRSDADDARDVWDSIKNQLPTPKGAGILPV